VAWVLNIKSTDREEGVSISCGVNRLASVQLTTCELKDNDGRSLSYAPCPPQSSVLTLHVVILVDSTCLMEAKADGGLLKQKRGSASLVDKVSSVRHPAMKTEKLKTS
jgi:hypothetical protein